MWGGKKQYYRDDETSLYLMGFRYYDAKSGRFTSEDPIRQSAGDTNLYRPMRNDPVNRSDPSGLVAQGEINWQMPVDYVTRYGAEEDNKDFIARIMLELRRRKDYHYNRIEGLYGATSDNPSADRKALAYYHKQYEKWRNRLDEVTGVTRGWVAGRIEQELAAAESWAEQGLELAIAIEHARRDPLGTGAAAYKSAVENTSALMSIGLVEGGSVPMALWEGAGYLVGSAFGVTSIGEAAWGVDLITVEELSTLDRWTRGSGGVSMLAFSVAGGAGSLARGKELPLQSFRLGGPGAERLKSFWSGGRSGAVRQSVVSAEGPIWGGDFSGRFVSSGPVIGGGQPVVLRPLVHGNSAASSRTTFLYRLVDKEGNFLKWGITQNLEKRYTRMFMADKRIYEYARGSRADMLRLERNFVEIQPGPLNFERWAGRRLGEQP